ncbi:MAG: NAD(+) synthase [Steroidobacteraceae bacterium]
MAQLPALDFKTEADRICEFIRGAVQGKLRRRGLVVAMSGGIDSSACAALAVRALGPERVFGLLLPERDSSSTSGRLGRALAQHLGIQFAVHELSPTLTAIGCYASQDEVLRRALPGFDSSWKFKLAIQNAMGGRIGITRVVADDPQGRRHEARLSAADYLQLVAATNFKQRVRKTLEYYHADRLNYAVTGTPNRLEYELGFFVKNGDGAADVKPIAHLYKSDVYAMARFLGLPAEVTGTTPTTDTFSLPQGQDEFYFGLPFAQMDVALWMVNTGRPVEDLAAHLGSTVAVAREIVASIASKKRAAEYLHAAALRIEV